MVIVVSSQKGGVGKTTTAVSLAHGLALKHYRAVLVDLDPQGHCALLLGMKEEPGVFGLLAAGQSLREVVRPTGRSGLYLVPGNKKTAVAQVSMVLEGYRHTLLQEVLRSGIEKAHHVILDTAPSAGGGLQENALYMADLLLIPVALDFLALDGIAKLLTTLDSLARPSAPVVWILPTFHDGTTKESRVNLGLLRQRFGERVKHPVHRATLLREAAAAGKTVFEYAPESRAAAEYADLVLEVCRG